MRRDFMLVQFIITAREGVVFFLLHAMKTRISIQLMLSALQSHIKRRETHERRRNIFLRFFPQAPPTPLTALLYSLDYFSLFIGLFLHNLFLVPNYPVFPLYLRIVLHTLYMIYQRPLLLLLAKLALALTLLSPAPLYLLLLVLCIEILSAGVYSFTRSQRLQDTSLDAQLNLLPLFISQSSTYATVCLICIFPGDCVPIVLVQLVINQACLKESRLYHQMFQRCLHHTNISLLVLAISLLLFPSSLLPLLAAFLVAIGVLGLHLGRRGDDYSLEGDEVQCLIVLSQLVQGSQSKDKQYAKLQLIQQLKEGAYCKEEEEENDLQDYFELRLKSAINSEVEKLFLFYAPSPSVSHPSLTYTRLLLSLSSTSASALPFIPKYLSVLTELHQTLLSSRICANHLLSLLASISHETEILQQMESDNSLYRAFRSQFLPFLPHILVPSLTYEPDAQVEISHNHIVSSSLGLIRLTGYTPASPVLKAHLLYPPKPMVYLPHRTLYSVFTHSLSPFHFQWQYSTNAVICVNEAGYLIALNQLCAYFNIPPHPSTATLSSSLLLELKEKQEVFSSSLFDILLPEDTGLRLLKTVNEAQTIHYIQLQRRKQQIVIDLSCGMPPSSFGFYWNSGGISNIAPNSPLIFTEKEIVPDLPVSVSLAQNIITMRLSNGTIDYIQNFEEEDEFQSYAIKQDSSPAMAIDNESWYRVGIITIVLSICSFLILIIFIYVNTLSIHSSDPLRLLTTLHRNNLQYKTAILLSTLRPTPPLLNALLNTSLSTADSLSHLDPELSLAQSSLDRLKAIANLQILLSERSGQTIDILGFQAVLAAHLSTYEQVTAARMSALMALNYVLFSLGALLALVYCCVIIKVNGVAHSQLLLALQKWKALPVSTLQQGLIHIDSFILQHIHQREPPASIFISSPPPTDPEAKRDACLMDSRRLSPPSKPCSLLLATLIPLFSALLLTSPFLRFSSLSVSESYLNQLYEYLTHLQTTYVLLMQESQKVKDEIMRTYDSQAAMILSFRGLWGSITPTFLAFHKQVWNGKCCQIYATYNLTNCDTLISGGLTEGSTQLVAYLNTMYDTIAQAPSPKAIIHYVPYLIPILTSYIPVLQDAIHSEFLSSFILPPALTPLLIAAIVVLSLALLSSIPLTRMHRQIDRALRIIHHIRSEQCQVGGGV